MNRIIKGTLVAIVQKQHQNTGQLTTGIVSEVLTNSQTHPRGIKVRLESGLVGRVQQIKSGNIDATVSETASKSVMLSDFIMDQNWSCLTCTLDNAGGQVCLACGDERKIQCLVCTFINISSMNFCGMCSKPLK